MRKLALFLAVAGSAVVLTRSFGATDDTTPTQGCLRIIPKDGDTNSVVELPLKHTKVEAEISGFVGRVKVTQTFANPSPDPIEAVYVFPLPQNAAVGDMQIRIADRVIKGLIKKRDEARQIYEEARKAGKTAALLEQDRPNIFMQSVANILPGHDILVEITYDETLAYEKGGYEFVFPMVVGPRFIPGAPTGRQGGGWSPDTDQVPDASRITPPVLKPGERNGHDIEVSVRLDPGIPVHGLECPSHRIVVSPAPSEVEPITAPCTIELAPNDTVPNKDFVLRYRVAGEKPEMGLLAHGGELGGFFMLMFQPPEAPAPETVTPKEMVFVVDCSGSMSGEPIALAKKAVRYALENLNPGDSFQIIRFSESASPFATEPIENTPANVRRGLSYINGLEGEGGTMMIEGIKAALDFPHHENRLRIVCFMTDGYVGNESEILAAIREKLGDNTRLFSFGVGSSVNRYLLERMGEVGRGEVQYVLLNEKPEETVKKFYERVRNPVLTHIRVDWAGLDVEDIYPSRIRDLFAGQPIFVRGRFGSAGSATVKVTGKIAGEDVTYKIPVTLPDAAPGNAALAPLWARARIEALMSEQYGGEQADVVEQVTALALEYRLMSQYTSFVAVEERVVNESGKLTTVQVPVEMPAGVSYEGVFGDRFEADRAAFAGASYGSVMKQGFSARSAVGFMSASGLHAVAAPAASIVHEEAPAEDQASIPSFEVELKLDKDRRTIHVTAAGEIWDTRTDASGQPTQRVLAGRLTREEIRELWELVSEALASPVVPETLFDEDGRLSVGVWDASGAKKESAVALKAAAGAGEVTTPWARLAQRVLKAAE